MKLNVFFGSQIAGQLETTADKGVIFTYDENYISSKNALPLSCSLPLKKTAFSQKEALPFFAGLLPEGDLGKVIARSLHISENSYIKLLDALGGECAGMLSFFPENEKPDDEEKYIPLPFSIIEAEYKKKTTVPMLIANKEVRLSLAGAQDKVPVHLKDGSFYLPAGGAVSTHIIKPPMKNFPDTVWNEYFCMKLASACKLEAAAVSLHIMSFPLLLIKRYDRQLSENGKLIRLHQEDFCQALGYMPEMKYESEGGPGFKACAELIMQYCTRPAAEKDKLIKWTVFNFLIGNADAHSKNISLLYENNKISVAPFYDLLCTEIYPALSNKLSMGIGGKKDPDKIDKTSFEKLASEIHVKASYLIKSAEELSALMLIKAAELKEESLSKYNTNETVFDLIIDHIKRRSKIFL